MIQQPTVDEVMGMLAAAFPRQELNPTTIRVYIEDLSDLPLPALAAAAVQLRRGSRFFPTIAEIREAACEQILGLPSEADALAMVEARGRGRMHPLVEDTFRLVGGSWAWRTAEEPTVIRGQFLRLYRERRAEAVRAVQLDASGLPDGRAQLSA